MATPIQIVIDCADPRRLAEFWAGALGYTLQPAPPGFESWEKFLTERGVPESEWNSRNAVVDPDGHGRVSSSNGCPSRRPSRTGCTST